MATYKGNDIVQEDQGDEDRKLLGRGLPGAGEVKFSAPEVGTDRTRRPGERGYMKGQHMAGIKDIEDWDPKTGSAIEKKHGAPVGSPRQQAPMREIDPNVDAILPGGGIMKGRSPTYSKGGMVKAGSPKVSAPCGDTKTLKCY